MEERLQFMEKMVNGQLDNQQKHIITMSRLTFARSAGTSAGPKMTDGRTDGTYIRYRQTDRGHVERLR